VAPNWKTLIALAEPEIERTLAALPEPLRTQARQVPVICERWPDPELVADGVDAELLGLFVGDALAAGGEAIPSPPRIFLFLENLRDFAEDDPEIFREEVRVTLLHELGHYLGLDEDDLEARGLL
jgi:predicted Zn-dependent protease with MMP-like domain